MSNSNYKLFTVLNSLTKVEWRAYEEYLLTKTSIASDNYRLFKVLDKQKNKLDRKRVLETIHKRDFNDLTQKGLLNIMSRLYRWLDEYLKLSALLSHEYSAELALIKTYNTRGIYELATKKAKILEDKLLLTADKNLEHQTLLRQLYHLLYYSDNPIKYKEGTALLRKLIRSYATNTHDYAVQYDTELINWGRIKTENFHNEHELLLPLIKSNSTALSSKVLSSLHNLISNYDVKGLEEIVSFIKEEKLDVHSELHTLATLYGVIYGLRLWNKNLLSNPDVFTILYEEAFKYGKYASNGKIPEQRFYSTLASIGTLKSIDWCYSFIEKWVNHVDTENTIGVIHLAKAIISFYHKNYSDILIHLRENNYKESRTKYRAYSLMAAAAYKEQKSVPDFLDSILLNYKISLNRNKRKLSKNLYQGNINFILALSQLSKIKNSSEIKYFPENFEELVLRNWINEQYDL